MTTDQFAIVPIPEYGPLRDTINAIAVSTGGPLATIIAGLDARADAEELLTRVGEEAERSQPLSLRRKSPSTGCV